MTVVGTSIARLTLRDDQGIARTASRNTTPDRDSGSGQCKRGLATTNRIALERRLHWHQINGPIPYIDKGGLLRDSEKCAFDERGNNSILLWFKPHE
jgi:hypothetical protein